MVGSEEILAFVELVRAKASRRGAVYTFAILFVVS